MAHKREINPHTGRPLVVDDDAPEFTAEMFARAVPIINGDVVGAAMEAKRRYRSRQKAATKVAITLRLDRETLARYRATGRGWQTRLAASLLRLSRRLPAPPTRRRARGN